MIKKIDDYDSRDVRHVDAQNLLQNSEAVRLVVERSELLRESPSINRYYSPQLSIVESIPAGNEPATFNLSEQNLYFIFFLHANCCAAYFMHY